MIRAPACGTRDPRARPGIGLIGRVALFTALVLVPASGISQAPSRVQGCVRDSETGNPLFAIVAVEGTKLGAVCGQDGRFSIEVRDTGTFILKASMISYEERRLAVHVPQKNTLVILLDPQPISIAEVSVTSSTLIDKYSTSEKAITKMEVYRLPGIGADIVYASLMLPGLNSYPDAAMILARGGAQDETAIYFDGIRIKHPFRFDSPIYGGNFSILSNEIIRTSYISRGGVPVKYDNVLSGVLDLSSENNVPGNQLQLGAGLASAGVYTALRTRTGKTSALANVNFMDTKYFFKVNPSRQEMTDTPSGNEFYLKLMQDIAGIRTYAAGLYADDKYESPGYYETSSNGLYMCGAEYASRSWIAALRLGYTRYRQSSTYYSPSENSAQVHFESAYEAERDIIIELGAEEYSNSGTYLTADSSARLNYYRTGVYGDVKFRLASRLFSKVGLRMGTGSLFSSPAYEPRVFLAYEADKNTIIKWNAGIYRSFYDDNVLAYAASPQPREAYYTEVSLEKSFVEMTEANASVYYKYYTKLLTPSGYNGFGYSRGVDIFVKSIGKDADIWFSYGLDDSKRKEWDFTNGIFDDALTPSPYAPLHSVKAAYIRKFAAFNAGARFSFFTGFHYTEFYPSLFGPPVRGPQNGAEYPSYTSIDLNFSEVLPVSDFFAVVYLSVTNIFDAKNIRAYIYDSSAGQAETYFGFGRSIYFGAAFVWQ